LTSDAEINAKLARIGRRIEARAESVRDELEAIGALEIAVQLRSRFGARLVYIKTPSAERGDAIRAAHTEARDSLRELKFAQYRRARALENIDRLCVEYGISARKFSRLVRGVDKGTTL
jgi:hypothetical protein